MTVPHTYPKKSYIPPIRNKAIVFIFSASIQTCSSIANSPINNIMSKTEANSSFSKSSWDGSDKDGFASLDHPGYSMECNADFTGGWHVHRKVWEEQEGDKEDKRLINP